MNTIENLNKFCSHTLIDHLGIQFIESGNDFLKARMPVDQRTIQPMQILHGGASLALAETVGSAASFLLIDQKKYNVVGMQVTANHIGTTTKGHVYADARLLHKGTKTHVWDVTITDDSNNKISVCRITNMIVEKK